MRFPKVLHQQKKMGICEFFLAVKTESARLSHHAD